MIWMTWRQFRAQAIVAVGALAVLAVYLVVTGLAIRDAYTKDFVSCRSTGGCHTTAAAFTSQYSVQLTIVAVVLIAVPGVIGIFWGAPLITRELETGTYRLVWNQSITRGRWLAVKLAVIGLVSVAVTGLLSLLVTWAASPVDRLTADRFSPLLFDSRNIAPLGYAAFAFVLGTTIGLLIRRTVPAMAVTLAVFAGVQLLLPFVVRPHLMTPEHSTIALNAQTLNTTNLMFTGDGDDARLYVDVSRKGDWVVSGRSEAITATGQVAKGNQTCAAVPHSDLASCLAQQGLQVPLDYQPASRYWTFQWLETGIFLAMSGLLSGFCFWWIKGRRS